MSMSGGKMHGFREGWALRALSWGRAHYFQRDGVGIATSLCGAQDAAAGWLHEPGTFPRCKRCEAMVAKMPPKPGEKSPGAGVGSGEPVGEG